MMIDRILEIEYRMENGAECGAEIEHKDGSKMTIYTHDYVRWLHRKIAKATKILMPLADRMTMDFKNIDIRDSSEGGKAK